MLSGAATVVFRDDDDVAISAITRAELFAGGHVDEDALAAWLTPFTEHAVDRGTAGEGGRLRRQHPTVLLPDALIAATARFHRRTLITRNLRHFTAIDRLALASPDEPSGPQVRDR